MNRIGNPLVGAHPPARIGSKAMAGGKPAGASFFDELTKASALKPSALRLSKHASNRLAERGICISAAEWETVSERVSDARKKGVVDSLVLLEQAALVVSAKNAVVITAMDRSEACNQLFTNIDGTIVLN